MFSWTRRAAAPPHGGRPRLYGAGRFSPPASGFGFIRAGKDGRGCSALSPFPLTFQFPQKRYTKCEKTQEERLTKPPACGILHMEYTSWNLPENGAFVCLRKRFERRGREGKTRFVRRKPPCFRTERGGKRKRSVGAYEKDRSVDKKRRIAAYRRAAGRRAGRLRGNARGNAQSPPLRRRIRRICQSTNTAARRARRREWGR